MIALAVVLIILGVLVICLPAMGVPAPPVLGVILVIVGLFVLAVALLELDGHGHLELLLAPALGRFMSTGPHQPTQPHPRPTPGPTTHPAPGPPPGPGI